MDYSHSVNPVYFKSKNNMTLKIEIKKESIILKIKLKLKKFRSDNKDKRNEDFRKRKASDINFKTTCNLRSRTSMAFRSQNVRKTKTTFDLLGCSHSFFQRWILYQLDGNMTVENYGSVWQIDHCLAIASFNLLDEMI